MTRLPAIPIRDPDVPGARMRDIALLAATTAQRDVVAAAFRAIVPPGWVRVNDDPAALGWVQRRPDLWPAIAGSVFTMGWIDPTVSTEHVGDGWAIVRVEADGSAGSRIDVRGTLDAAMERALSGALAEVDARLLRRWDPSAAMSGTRAMHRIPPDVRPRPRPGRG